MILKEGDQLKGGVVFLDEWGFRWGLSAGWLVDGCIGGCLVDGCVSG